jgi:5'-nucleotidase
MIFMDSFLRPVDESTNRPVGGAAVLVRLPPCRTTGFERDPDLSDRTFIVHAGDHVGATPPESALLQDEPVDRFLKSPGQSILSV